MSKPIPTDKALYAKAKKMADAVYDRPSAYKSGYIVKKYKELGGKYSGGNKQNSNLNRWYKEDWRDVNPKKTKTSYPVYRPTKRVNAKTPLTDKEIDKKDLLKQSRLKQKIKSKKLPPFKKK
jgi:hypothetical protein